MKGVWFISYAICLLSTPLFAQNSAAPRKVLNAVRTAKAPVIDGDLSDECWTKALPATDFTTTYPNIGKPSAFRSEVKVIYDDDALYVGAMLYDPEPEKILHELSGRDYGSCNSDKFSMQLNTYDDDQNAFHFEVTASNVQKDIKISPTQWDGQWDAVWESGVKINKKGWSVEFRIPYSQIRFPKKQVQQWAVNFFRENRRTSESSSWNYYDRSRGSQLAQAGLIKGVEGIKMPFRLMFYPYVSGTFEKSENGNSYAYSAGMDLKMGLTEGFTLDMMLIPDFGQRKSDYDVLNLSPYETYYGETRQFFSEGTELFSKAGLFYSRRIGRQPRHYQEVKDSIKTGETLIDDPDETKLINAVKVTGRNTNGLGIGFLNAVTENIYATVRRADGQVAKILTEPFSNYNIMVADQSIGKYSYLNFTNTNAVFSNIRRAADVLGSAFRFADENNDYAFYGRTAFSYIYDGSENETKPGAMFDLGAGKVSGNFRYSYGVKWYGKQFDINDMGYLSRSNLFEHNLWAKYGVYEPKGNFLNWSVSAGLHESGLSQPVRYSSTYIDASFNATFMNYFSVGTWVTAHPITERDFFEPREWGRYSNSGKWFGGSIWYNTDGRKQFSFSNSFDLYHGKYGNTYGASYGLSYRVNDKFSLYQGTSWSLDQKSFGYVEAINYDTVYFGRRDVPNITVSLSGSYVFNNTSSLSLDVRHNWTRVDYKDFFFLNPDGSYGAPGSYNPDDKDINYNTVNVDLTYSWNFAPGSFMTFMWKNKIYSDDTVVDNQFLNAVDNFKHTLNLPQTNTVSFKVSYYLDYKYLTRLKKLKES